VKELELGVWERKKPTGDVDGARCLSVLVSRRCRDDDVEAE
jgi:hypothetical protein